MYIYNIWLFLRLCVRCPQMEVLRCVRVQDICGEPGVAYVPLLVYISKCMFSFVFLLQLLLLTDVWLKEEGVTGALWVNAVTSLGLWRIAMTRPESARMMDVFLRLVK